MGEYTNFKREYRLSAGKAGNTGFEIGETSSSKPVPIHIEFSIQKSDLETQNTAKLSVWNLNKSQLSCLEEKDCVLTLRAGYGNILPVIFSGIVSYASTSIDNADRKTEMEIVDNLVQLRDSYVSVSYNGKVNWKTIYSNVAEQIGVAISFAEGLEFSDVHNGYSFVGQAKSILTKGCNCCGHTWSLQNGVLQIKKSGGTMSREVYVLNNRSGLIGIPSRVVVSKNDSTGENTMGWDVEYLLNGAIQVSDYIKLESNIVTGYFTVYSLEISGDNISGDWLCKARLTEAK